MAKVATETLPMDVLDVAIGRVSRAWAHLELSLAVIMAELMEVGSETALIVSAALDYRHRRDLIGSLADLKLKGNEPLTKLLVDFMASVKGMNTERNGTVHALWFRDPDTRKMIRLTMLNRGTYEMKFRGVAPGHLRAVADKINALAHQGRLIADALRVGVHIWRERYPPLDWPRQQNPSEHHPESTPDKHEARSARPKK